MRRRWDAAAVGWEAEQETVTAFTAPVADALIVALEPQPADTVLDLAAGTGDVTEALAGRVARVISTDLSPVMVDAARRRGVAGVEHRVMDMQAIDLPDASVDAVVSRFGYMLVAEPERAFSETRRVLRPGGRLAFATWAPAKQNPWATAYGPVLIERGLMEPPNPDEPGQFSLSDPDRIEALVRAAGFDELSIIEVPVVFRAAGWAEYRRVVSALAAVMREVLERLDAKERAEVDERAKARLQPFRSDNGYALPGLALVTTAR
ncbi:MAG TPA: class I SAM-dependent methyltransferase [Gaiellaceae bacterium]|nr:class I SAM-dependent methyltransferase [Gaiellaceae bacterium]